MIRFVTVLLLVVASTTVAGQNLNPPPEQDPVQALQKTPSNLPAMTLDEVLKEARRANAALPVARFDVRASAAAVREARARLWPQALVDGRLEAARPGDYGANDAVGRVVGRETLYDGGRLRAGIRIASANERAARAGLRMQEKDLDLAVESSYYDVVEADREIDFRQQAIQRVKDYLLSERERKAAGEGVESAVLKATVLVDTEQATLADLESRRDDARLTLNQLMGRNPSDPLTLAPLPPPAPPPAVQDEPWQSVPELQQAEANRAAAIAQIAAVRAGRRPHVDITASAGHIEPLFWANNLASNPNAVGRATGAGIAISVTWPIFDFGIYNAQLAQARFAADREKQLIEVARQQARLQWQRAVAQLNDLYRELGVLDRMLPEARDAALNAESMYRGGAATSLEVVDAYRTWISANQSYVQAVRRYRDAEANLARWGTR